MKRFLLAAALIATAAPAHAGLWTGNGSTKTETNRFTGETSTVYEAKKGDCGVAKSVKSQIAFCLDRTNGSGRSITLGTTAKGWEVMRYRASSNDTANVILTHHDGSKETTTLPAVYSGDTIGGSTVMEAVIVKAVPATVKSLEVQYGGVEYWYAPSHN